jgi:hypothetical protein
VARSKYLLEETLQIIDDNQASFIYTLAAVDEAETRSEAADLHG